MISMTISLDSIEKIKQFVNTISAYPYDFDLASGRYIVDAKSIMGIFSLDLSEPITLNIHTGEKEEELRTALAPYLV